MALYKRKRKVKLANGKTVVRQSTKWHIKYRDADGIERRVTAFTDKQASKQLEAQLIKEAELAEAGIVDRFKSHRKRPLSEHLEDFKQSLIAKGNTADYVKTVVARATKVIEGCGFVVWQDIVPDRVQQYLAGLRDNGNGISVQTSNFYLQAVKQFCRWMKQNLRAGELPLDHLSGLNVRMDRRHDRRALEPDEIRRLLEAAGAVPVRCGMTGYERVLLYRMAVETGLRASELRSLTVSSLDFSSHTVTVAAGYSKHRKTDTLPIRKDTAVLLEDFVQGKLPSVQIFKVPAKPAKMIKKDLADAGIDYIGESGKYADFHALRPFDRKSAGCQWRQPEGCPEHYEA